jgi:hypothetical protein
MKFWLYHATKLNDDSVKVELIELLCHHNQSIIAHVMMNNGAEFLIGMST